MTDRRSVLAGLGALGLMGCAPKGEAAAFVAPAAPEDFDLSALEQAHGGRMGFFAHDLGTGRQLSARGDERFVYCSTFKMYLSAATLMRVQAGEEQLDRAIPITRADMISHAPVTEPAVGSTLSATSSLASINAGAGAARPGQSTTSPTWMAATPAR